MITETLTKKEGDKVVFFETHNIEKAVREYVDTNKKIIATGKFRNTNVDVCEYISTKSYRVTLTIEEL
jgi:hypothetical protein